MKCLKCEKNIPSESVDNGNIICPNCNAKFLCTLFPAYSQNISKGINADNLDSANDASCYYHSDKVAVSACAKCGVYICALCDIRITEEHLCPKCFNKNKNDITLLQMQTTMYDEIAFNIVAISMLIWPLMFITAPCMIIYSIWNFKHFNYPYKRSKFRIYFALIVSILQIIGIIFIIYSSVIGFQGLKSIGN